MASIAPLLTERELELLKKNLNSVIYEPKVAAVAFAIAAVLDRIRFGTIPEFRSRHPSSTGGDARREPFRQTGSLAGFLRAACRSRPGPADASCLFSDRARLVLQVELSLLRPNALLLAGAVVLDLLIGDPVYLAHPIRLMGNTLTWLENGLRKLGADGYGGGIALFSY